MRTMAMTSPSYASLKALAREAAVLQRTRRSQPLVAETAI